MTIRAHFDGTVLVPDEPVNLPVNTPLDIDVRQTAPVSSSATAGLECSGDQQSIADRSRRRAALQRFAAHAVSGTDIPAGLLRREKLYDDRA